MIGQEILYKHGTTELLGYLAIPENLTTKTPAVMVVPEWWGHNDYVRKRAEDVANLGYIGFAIDMYGKNVSAETPPEAITLSKPFFDDRLLMRARAQAALETLKQQKNVDASRLGAMGYCFGGTVCLEMARAGENLRGAVSFHGGLATTLPAQKGAVKSYVLALNGGADPFVSDEEKQNFIEEMTDADVHFKSIDYPGVTHAFTNPEADVRGKKFGLPLAYNKEADQKSFAEMVSFFKERFS